MSQTYMTAKLNLSDGTIVYPQVSLDNIVNSINDPTLASVATGISISVDGGTATLVTNGGSGVAKFVGANGLVVSMNEGNEVVFTAPSVTSVGSAGYADNAGSAVSAGTASVASSLVSSYVVSSATNATSAGTAAAITSGAIVGGYKTEIISGNTVGQMKWFNIVNTAGATVTVEPGEAYKINAANSAVTISATLGTVGQWGQEGHAEIFVVGTGNVHTGANVTLADGLEPDSVNNCTLRFHDGKCIISVEDHVAGYIVVSATGTSAGTLYYALGTASEEYIAVDASLNGTTLDLAGAVAEGEKHIVGNGYNETAISGTIDCSTNKVTVANLSLQDVGITSGTLTLGDVYIPDGATVAVSGGGLAVEKVTGAGETSVIDRGGTTAPSTYGMPSVNYDGVTIISGFGSGGSGGGAYIRTTVGNLKNCTFTQNSGAGGAIALWNPLSGTMISGCTFSGNTPNNDGTIEGYICSANASSFTMKDCTLEAGESVKCNSNFAVSLEGNNVCRGVFASLYGDRPFTVILTSGAIVDLTGNTNATPIAPGGGITFAPGGATVLYSSGAVSGSYSMDNVRLSPGAKLTNTAVINLGGANVVVSSGTTASASGCTFTGGYASYGGGAFEVTGGSGVQPALNLDDCVITGNTTSNQGTGILARNGATIHLENCVVSGNMVDTVPARDIYASDCELIISGGTYSSILNNYASVGLGGIVRLGTIYTTTSGTVTISSGASINLTNSIAPGVGIVVDGGCVVNGVDVAGGTYTSIVSSGGSAVVNP